MDRFEDAIVDLTGDNGFAELVMARTGFGVKTWLFYTNDQERFVATFNRLLSSHPKYPIEVSSDEDPDWTEWASIRDDLKTRAIEGTPVGG